MGAIGPDSGSQPSAVQSCTAAVHQWIVWFLSSTPLCTHQITRLVHFRSVQRIRRCWVAPAVLFCRASAVASPPSRPFRSTPLVHSAPLASAATHKRTHDTTDHNTTGHTDTASQPQCKHGFHPHVTRARGGGRRGQTQHNNTAHTHTTARLSSPCPPRRRPVVRFRATGLRVA